MAFRMIEEDLEIIRETISKTLVEYLGKRNYCARFVPHCITDEPKAFRLQTYQEFIQSVDDDRFLFD
jgi:hypothetical protein